MAKLRRSAGRPSPVKKARAAAPAARPKSKPAVKKSAPKSVKPTAKKSPAPKAAARAKKPLASRSVKPAAPAAARPVPKPKAQAAPPPKRSTYADAVMLYERGLQALQHKRYREAADTLKRVIVEFPEEIELHERAQLYIRVCERQITPPDSTPKTPEEQVLAATLALNTGATDRAIALLNGLLQRQADNDAAEYMLGVALATKGDHQGALQHLAHALELNPDSRDAMRKEAELESLRETEAFQAMLAAAAAAPRKDRRPRQGTKRT